jgi:hypothetical protein
MKYTTGTKTHCEAVQAAADKLLGYPKTAKGGAAFSGDAAKVAADALLLTGQKEFVPVPGPDVEMPTYAKPRKHPTTDEHAYPITGDMLEALEDQDKRARCSLMELIKLDTAKATAAELTEDWDDQGEDDG